MVGCVGLAGPSEQGYGHGCTMVAGRKRSWCAGARGVFLRKCFGDHNGDHILGMVLICIWGRSPSGDRLDIRFGVAGVAPKIE